MEVYGYARVSSKDQNVQRQLDAFYREGIEDKYILIDKETGKNFDRKNYNLLVGTELTAPLLRKGDCLTILDLDRLGRNYTEIQQQWRNITEVIGADIKVIDMPMLNTSKSEDDLEKKFIRDLVFQILSYVAEKERSKIRERQRQGIDSAKASGKKCGRPSATYPDGWEKIYDQWSSGKLRSKDALEMSGLKTNTFYNLLKRWEHEHKIDRKTFYNKKI